jgi:hypothetical protein
MSPGNEQQDYLAEAAPQFNVLGRLGERPLERRFQLPGER